MKSASREENWGPASDSGGGDAMLLRKKINARNLRGLAVKGGLSDSTKGGKRGKLNADRVKGQKWPGTDAVRKWGKRRITKTVITRQE